MIPMRTLICSLFLIFAGLSAASAGERAFTLKEAIDIAMKDNPELRAMNNSVNAVNEDIGVARSHLLPKVAFEERFMRTANPTFAFSSKLNQERFSASDFAVSSLNNPAAINDFQTTISFEQPLYAKKPRVGLKMAKKEYSSRLEDLSRKKEEVAFNIVKTALMARSAAEFASAAEKGVEDAKEHLRLAQLRYDANLGLYSDVLRASTGLTGAEERLVSARKNLSVAKRALGLLLGVSDPVEITGEAPETGLKDIDYYKNASTSRKDIKALEIRAENARVYVDFAKADYYPVIGVGGAYQLNDHGSPFGSEGDSWQVSAFLRWSIYDGTLRRHETSKAKYKEAEAAEYLSGLKKSVSFMVYEAYLCVEEALKNTELSDSAVKTAEEGERLVRIRYENSLSPMVDLLDSQTSLDNARANSVVKRNDYKFSLIRLSFESGTLLKDLGLE